MSEQWRYDKNLAIGRAMAVALGESGFFVTERTYDCGAGTAIVMVTNFLVKW